MKSFPRINFLNQPTPCENLNRLSDLLEIDLWIKRDDLAGLSFGGNKTRQLEYYLGAAIEQNADTILITGAVQSNFTRLAVAYAAKLGMKTIVQLENRVDNHADAYQHSGNPLLSQILGAEIITYPEGEDEAGADQALYEKAEALKTEGRIPYVIPLGKIEYPLGALGYHRAAEEILSQDSQFDYIIAPSGSGMTHAGLLAGFANHSATVIGACVRRNRDLQTDRITKIMSSYQDMIEENLSIASEDIHIWDGALAPGYGQLGPISKNAIKMMAQYEGLILDPVYTAKSFAAVPALVRSGLIPKGSRVCYVHTGGLGAVFAYQDQLQNL